MALFRKTDDNKIVSEIKQAAGIRFDVPSQIFDTRNKGMSDVNRYSQLIFSYIRTMNDVKQRNMLIAALGGESKFLDMYTRLHIKLKELYDKILVRSRENIDSLHRDYQIMERKFGGSLELGKGNSQADNIRYRLADAKSFLTGLKRNPVFLYISKWDKSGVVNFNYEAALSTLKGVYKSLRMAWN